MFDSPVFKHCYLYIIILYYSFRDCVTNNNPLLDALLIKTSININPTMIRQKKTWKWYNIIKKIGPCAIMFSESPQPQHPAQRKPIVCEWKRLKSITHFFILIYLNHNSNNIKNCYIIFGTMQFGQKQVNFRAGNSNPNFVWRYRLNDRSETVRAHKRPSKSND